MPQSVASVTPWAGRFGAEAAGAADAGRGDAGLELDLTAITAVIDTWCDPTAELGRSHAWVQVFENKGAAMGCSQPQPHGQVWATDDLSNEPATEDARQRLYHAQQGRSMLLDMAEREAAT